MINYLDMFGACIANGRGRVRLSLGQQTSAEQKHHPREGEGPQSKLGKRL